MRELGSKMADAASSRPPQLGRAASPGVEPALLGQPTVMDATQMSLRLDHERQSPSGQPESATVTMLVRTLRLGGQQARERCPNVHSTGLLGDGTQCLSGPSH